MTECQAPHNHTVCEGVEATLHLSTSPIAITGPALAVLQFCYISDRWDSDPEALSHKPTDVNLTPVAPQSGAGTRDVNLLFLCSEQEYFNVLHVSYFRQVFFYFWSVLDLQMKDHIF